VDAHLLPSELERVCESCLVPSLPSNRKDINVRILVRNDVNAHPLPIAVERVCESCLSPSLRSLPSNRKDINMRSQWEPLVDVLVCMVQGGHSVDFKKRKAQFGRTRCFGALNSPEKYRNRVLCSECVGILQPGETKTL
jgi:hypothetical protein